jgi:hypothetical protein
MRAVTEEGSDMGGATLQREMERGAILRPEADRGREDSRDLARWQEVSAKKDSRGIGNCWRELAYDRYQYHAVYLMAMLGTACRRIR